MDSVTDDTATWQALASMANFAGVSAIIMGIIFLVWMIFRERFSECSGRIHRYLSVYLPYIIIVGICIIFPLLSIFDILVPVLCLLNVISGTSCAVMSGVFFAMTTLACMMCSVGMGYTLVIPMVRCIKIHIQKYNQDIHSPTESEISDTMHPSTMKAQKPEVPRDLSFNSITSHSSSFPETSESNSITRDVDSESPWEDHLEGHNSIHMFQQEDTAYRNPCFDDDDSNDQAFPHAYDDNDAFYNEGSSDYLLPVGIDETTFTTFQREEVNEQNLQVTSTDDLPDHLTHKLLKHMSHLEEVTKDLHSLDMESRNCPFEFGDDQQDTRPLSSFPHTVSALDAKIPEDVAQTCFVLGVAHTLHITHQGGTFPLHPFGPRGREQQVECCATLEAPSGVVGSGVTVSVHYAIILDGPFEFPEEWERTSVVLYIDCPEKQLLKELLCIKLRHWAVCPSDALAIMKADHTFTGVYGKDEFVFAQLNDFSDCQSFSDAVLFGLMDHFCLICTAMKCTRSANLSPCHTSCYLMKVPDNIEAAEFRVFLMYGVPSWIDAVQEYCMQEGRSGKLQRGVKKIVVSQPSVVLSIQRRSGQGWSLWMSEEKLSRDALKFDHFCKLSHADKKVEMRNFLYPPSVECNIVYKEKPREGIHEKNENTLTVSSGDNKAQFLIAVWDQKLLPDVLAAPKQSGWPDNSRVKPHAVRYGEPLKPLTVQNLMPYVNDLGDEVVSISGWLGMDGELSAITKTIGVTTPKERLQELLRMWLDNTESPTAPHTWENFVRVIRGVGKGHVADRIVEDLFTDSGLPSDPVALEMYVVSKMADNWYLFGIHLGLPEDTLKAIDKLKIKNSTRCLAMFQQWMEEVRSVGNKMGKIEQAMKEVMKVTGGEKSRMTSMCQSEMLDRALH